MTLGNILMAREPWLKLMKADLPAKMAYRLAKYHRQVGAELDVIEQKRVEILRAVAGVGPEEQVALKDGDPRIDTFFSKFNEFLQTESDLKPMPVTLCDAIDSVTGGTLSPGDLLALEVFFSPQN